MLPSSPTCPSIDPCVLPSQAEKGEMWVKEEDYLRMDGSTDPQQRKRFTNAFNDPKETRFCHLLVCL